MNEFEILQKFKTLATNHPSSLCLTDDACVLDKLSTKQFVVTTDSIVENVHFFSGDDPRGVAQKLLAVNLSDIAAMGGVPKYYLIAIVLNKKTNQAWVNEFCNALLEQNKKYDISAVGGDTVRHNGPMSLNMTMIGEIDKYNAVTRSGAKEDDNIYVTGSIGDAAIGLLIRSGHKFKSLTKAEKNFLIERYERPTARVEVGRELVKIANSMVDISDGFIQDASHISKNSNVQLEINLEDIPLSPALQALKDQPNIRLLAESAAVRGFVGGSERRTGVYSNIHEDSSTEPTHKSPAAVGLCKKSIIETALSGGDDYELLFTCPVKFEGSVNTIARETGVTITKIGKVTKGDKVVIKNSLGKEIKFNKAGYVH